MRRHQETCCNPATMRSARLAPVYWSWGDVPDSARLASGSTWLRCVDLPTDRGGRSAMKRARYDPQPARDLRVRQSQRQPGGTGAGRIPPVAANRLYPMVPANNLLEGLTLPAIPHQRPLAVCVRDPGLYFICNTRLIAQIIVCCSRNRQLRSVRHRTPRARVLPPLGPGFA
jgi:hypothetical protein